MTTEEIWEGDLFARRAEADLLIGYIESVAARRVTREDARGFTIAVDAGYGEGKTFFLRRLAQQLSINHPVAFVDAWKDDIADEPLAALAATLKSALDPLIERSDRVRDHWASVVEKTGKIAKLVGLGLLKRGLGLAITAPGAEAVSELLGNEAAAADIVKDQISEAGTEAVNNAAQALEGVAPHHLMEQRIREFRSGQDAIEALKASLTALVDNIADKDIHPPIVIIIDELDRCRPSYAVKLLEEIKHLFDVQGLVFILGLHGEQLARSINGSYGATFDGASYLSRFINRRYRLAAPDLTPLVSHLLESSGIDLARLQFPPIPGKDRNCLPDPAEMIAKYMAMYGFRARDAFQVIDSLQTCCAITKDVPIIMGYILPLLLSRMKDAEVGTLREPSSSSSSLEFIMGYDDQGKPRLVNVWVLANRLQERARMTQHELRIAMNKTGGDAASEMVYDIILNDRTANIPLARPIRYPDLIETVSRFTNPVIESRLSSEDVS